MALADLLHRHRLTQTVAARESGIPVQTLNAIVRGAQEPRRPTINRILSFARRYEPATTYESLFGGPDLPPPVVGNAA